MAVVSDNAPTCAVLPPPRALLRLTPLLLILACARDARSDARDAASEDAAHATHAQLDASSRAHDASADATSTTSADATSADAMSTGQASADAGAADASKANSCTGRKGLCVELCEGGLCMCSCGCQTSDDCETHFTCVAPTDPTPPCCGIAPACTSDATCPDDNRICDQRGCGACTAPCVDDVSCGGGYRCAGDGHCVHLECDKDGLVCPPGSHCAGVSTGGDIWGCKHDSCTTSADCVGGLTCVLGRCYEGVGRCAPYGCP